MAKGFSAIRTLPRSELDAALRDMRRERQPTAPVVPLPEITPETKAWVERTVCRLEARKKRGK